MPRLHAPPPVSLFLLSCELSRDPSSDCRLMLFARVAIGAVRDVPQAAPSRCTTSFCSRQYAWHTLNATAILQLDERSVTPPISVSEELGKGSSRKTPKKAIFGKHLIIKNMAGAEPYTPARWSLIAAQLCLEVVYLGSSVFAGSHSTRSIRALKSQ